MLVRNGSRKGVDEDEIDLNVIIPQGERTTEERVE